jgi:transcriptional regulator GlxA family with amidase domain
LFIEKKIVNPTITSPGLFETIRYIIETNGITNVRELAKRNFLSTRQFERNFIQFAGFSPKLFSRIIRFQSTLQEYGNQFRSLTDIAYDTGYYDQSHFIQDFKQFSGHNPKEYFSGKTESTQWREQQ